MTDRFACPECGAAIPLGDDLAFAEEEIRRLRRSNSAFKRLLDKQRKDSPLYAHAEECFHYWHEKTGKNSRTIFTEDREKAVLKQLEERTRKAADKDAAARGAVEMVKQAVDYIAALPYVTNDGRSAKGRDPEDRHDDLELICRSGSKLEKYAARGRALKPKRVLEPAKPPGWRERILRANGLRVKPLDKEDGRLLFECPVCGYTGRLEADEFECFALCPSERVDARLAELSVQDDQFRITEAAA